ncbi:MAG: hypothetical protein P8R54_25635 [Myxococcota bacterium]|nr:hypothetical protein [Myxococcota bacterium]
MLTLLLSTAALAASPAHYHPENVAGASAVFRDSADDLAPAFDKAQTTLARLARDLENLEIGVALLGDQAPAALQAWADESQKIAAVQYISMQRHVNLLQDGYETVFGAALDRALAAQSSYTIAECASGGGVTAMMRRGSSGSCEGTDLNADIAAAIDADATLKSDLVGLTDAPWPESGIEASTQAAIPLTGSGRDVNVAAMAEALIDDLLDRRLEDFEDALAPLEDGIDAGDESTLARAADLKDAYEAALAADGAVLLEAIQIAIARAGKKSNTDNIALCANPAGLGGCGGEDATSEVFGLIKDDRKLQKAVAGLNAR